jgi:uncharacterized protein (DUF433 family)
MISVIGNDKIILLQKRAADMTQKQLLARVRVNSRICAGRPHIRGTRIHIAIILDALDHGLTPAKIIEHYPSLNVDDVRAAVAYAQKLAQENGGLAMVNHTPVNGLRVR